MSTAKINGTELGLSPMRKSTSHCKEGNVLCCFFWKSQQTSREIFRFLWLSWWWSGLWTGEGVLIDIFDDGGVVLLTVGVVALRRPWSPPKWLLSKSLSSKSRTKSPAGTSSNKVDVRWGGGSCENWRWTFKMASSSLRTVSWKRKKNLIWMKFDREFFVILRSGFKKTEKRRKSKGALFKKYYREKLWMVLVFCKRYFSSLVRSSKFWFVSKID